MATVPAAKNYGLLTDLHQLEKVVTRLIDLNEWVGFDIETGYHGPDRAKGSVNHDWAEQFTTGFSFSGDPSWARYVPLHHDVGGNVSEPAKAWEIMEPLLVNGKIVAHNAKFEIRGVRKAAGYTIASGEGAYLVDTMLDAYVLSKYRKPNMMRGSHSLKELVKIIFDHDQAEIKTLFPNATAAQLDALRFNILPLSPAVISYCCEDAAWCLALKSAYGDEAAAERGAMRKIEHEIMQLMADVEEKGVAVDWDAINAAHEQAQQFVPQMERAVRAGLASMSGKDMTGFNLGSSPKMQELLYRDIGLRTTRMTKTKADRDDLEPWQKMSTDAIAMEGLSSDHPEIKKVLELREVNNLATRLKKWLVEHSIAEDGRVHANYNQVQVGSGRFAANDPAIQQLPKDWRWTTVLGVDPESKNDQKKWEEIVASGTNAKEYWRGNFRDFVVAGPGTYLLTYDYSQIELRILAGVTQEPALLEAFAADIDVHTMTAAMMLGKNPADVDPKLERPIGKTMNFALLYQMGLKSLAERLNISMDRAHELHAQYFSAFSRIASWQEEITAKALRQGYVETKWKRKYTIWELQSPNRAIQSKGRRVITNTPIQGGAADYMKLAMIRASRMLKEKGWWMTKCTIVGNLHDALTFEVTNDLDPQEVRDLIQAEVVFPIPGYPKIVADWELGQKWGSSVAWKADKVPKFDGKHWVLVKADEVPHAEPDPEPAVSPEVTASTVAEIESRTYEAEEGCVVVTMNSMPEQARYAEFIALLKSSPGSKEVRFACPQGEFSLGHVFALSAKDQGRVSLILGGATVTERMDDSDLKSLAEEFASVQS